MSVLTNLGPDGAGMTAPSTQSSPGASDPAPADAATPPRLGRNIVLVTAGRVSLLGAWFGATMLMARSLGPGSFGLYTLLQNAIRVVTGCTGDPLDMAVMREAPLYLRSDRPRALEVIRSAFWLRVAVGLMSAVVAAAVPWLISWAVFGSADRRGLAVLTGAGILGDLLLRSALGYFQVSERFGPFIATDMLLQLGRSAAVAALVFLHLMTAHSAIVLYVSAPYVAFGFAWLMLPRDVATPAAPHRQRLGDIMHYSKWMVAAMMMAAIYERLDLFMLSWFRGPHDVGIYAGAMALALIPDFVNGAVQTVLAPRVAPAHAAGTFAGLQRQYLTYAVPLGAAAVAGAMLLGGPVMQGFLSVRFAESVPAFKILVLGTLFDVVFLPLPTALLNFVAPRTVTAVTFLGLLLVSVGGLAVIPRFGVTGAALLILAARVTIGVVILLLARGIEVQSPAHYPAAAGPLPAELPGRLEDAV